MSKPTLAQVYRQPALLIATWFGAGLARKSPGTFGSLASLPFAYMIHSSFGGFALLVFAMLAFAVGCWASGQYVKRHPGAHDPGTIVIDEVAGQSLALCAFAPTWQAYLLGFLLFRLFDIIKPWPVSWADRKLHGSAGVMVDDLLAGFYPVLIFLALILMDSFSSLKPYSAPILSFLARHHVF